MQIISMAEFAKARKLHKRITFQGIPISVETRAGAYRHWYNPSTKESGKVKMAFDYGYVLGTEGTDGDHVDVFVGTNKDAPYAYIIDQTHAPDHTKFDEQKVMLGFDSDTEAKAAYLAHYQNSKFFSRIQKMDVHEFCRRVTDKSNHGEPVEMIGKFRGEHKPRTTQTAEERGVSKEDVKAQLRDAGFSKEDVKDFVGKQAGPYIGPRGGKWADPKHTISWTAHEQAQQPHHRVAIEHLRESDDIEDALQKLSGTEFERLHTPHGEVETKRVIEALKGYRPKKPKRGEATITVHHSTDVKTAKRLLREGFIPQSKPTNLARERYERGEYAEFAPGRGVSSGLYVGKEGATSGFGRVTLAIKVPKHHLHSSPEQKARGTHDPEKALATEDGAVVHEPIHPSRISKVDASAKTELVLTLSGDVKDFVGKLAGPYLGPHGGKYADPRHTVAWQGDHAQAHDAHMKLMMQHRQAGDQKTAEYHWARGKYHAGMQKRAQREEKLAASITPSFVKAGGPYIGPRGGKWADAKHTISWKERKYVHPQHTVHHARPKPIPKHKPSSFHVKQPESKAPEPARLDPGNVVSEPAYVYHATNRDRLYEIAQTGKLRTHAPHAFTDQRTWPDGATTKRSYFSKDARATASFAPEEGMSVLIRTKRSSAHRSERGTGDIYAEVPIPAAHLEYLAAGEAWHPVSALARTSESKTATMKSLAVPGAQLSKGGPYIGPRGGKWADPKHTISWHEQAPVRHVMREPEKKKEEPPKERMEARERRWVNAAEYGLPPDTQRKWKRDGGYAPERQKLHEAIYAEALSVPAVPEHKKPVAIVMMGGTASGKGTVIRHVMGDQKDFVHIDPDEAKERLPEYRQALDLGTAPDGSRISAKDAAAMAHEESSDIAEELRKRAVAGRKNLILDGTGKNAEKYGKKIEELRNAGYHIRLMMPHIDIEEARKRAIARATETGRYVPDSFVEEAHHVIPGNFERLTKLADDWVLFDNGKGPPPRPVWSGVGGLATIHDEAFVQEFQRLGKERHEVARERGWMKALLPMLIKAGDKDKPPSVTLDEMLERMKKDRGEAPDIDTGIDDDLENYREHLKRDKKLSKGALYIGPKGGKWANPQHTISWQGDRPIAFREPKRLIKDDPEKLLSALLTKAKRRGKGEGREIRLSRSELRTALRSTRFALVSAGPNPALEHHKSMDHKKRHEELRSKLVDGGYSFTGVVGNYGEREDSFLVMVHDAKRDDVRELGKIFEQESVIYVDRSKNELHYTMGDKADKNLCAEGRGFQVKPGAKSYFTRVQHPDGSFTKFMLNLDLGNLKECRKSVIHTLRKSLLLDPLAKAARPSGGGWHTIPRGKKGGFRRRRGSEYEYWYPAGAPQRPARGERLPTQPRAKGKPPRGVQAQEGVPLDVLEGTYTDPKVNPGVYKMETGVFKWMRSRTYERAADGKKVRTTVLVPNVDDKTKLQLIGEFTPLIRSEARKQMRGFALKRRYAITEGKGREEEVQGELQRAGMEGMLRAIRGYRGGKPFAPHAQMFVKRYMEFEAARQQSGFNLSVLHVNNLRRFIAAKVKAQIKYQTDDATPEQIASYFGLRLKHIHRGVSEIRRNELVPMERYKLQAGRPGETVEAKVRGKGKLQIPRMIDPKEQRSRVEWARMYDAYLKGQKNALSYDEGQQIFAELQIGSALDTQDQIMVRTQIDRALSRLKDLGEATITTGTPGSRKAPVTYSVDSVADLLSRRLGVGKYQEHSIRQLADIVPVYRKDAAGNWKEVSPRWAHTLLQSFVERGMSQLRETAKQADVTTRTVIDQATQAVVPMKTLAQDGPSFADRMKEIGAKLSDHEVESYRASQIAKFRRFAAKTTDKLRKQALEDGISRLERLPKEEVGYELARTTDEGRRIRAAIDAALKRTIDVERVGSRDGIAHVFDPSTGTKKAYSVRLNYDRSYEPETPEGSPMLRKGELDALSDKMLLEVQRWPLVMELLAQDGDPTMQRYRMELLAGAR